MKKNLQMQGTWFFWITLILLAGNCFGFEDTANSDLENDVLAALNAQASTAYLQTDGNELQLLEVVDSQQMVFQKIKNGLEILGNKVIVYLDDNGAITGVDDDSTQQLQTGANQADITAAEAVATAISGLKLIDPLDSESRLVWFRTGDAAVLAWQVETALAPTDAPVSPTDLHTVVDAVSGQVLSQSQIDTNVYQVDPKTGVGVLPRRIVINDAVGPAGSQTFALAYPEVCDIPGCTATLIASNVALTARHCGSLPGDFVRFGPDSAAPIFSTTVASVILPDGSGTLLDGGDVAILCLNSNVPDSVATPMRLIDATSSLIDMSAATIGYGLNGVGSTGHEFTSDGLRWGGENVIDVYGTPASANGSNIFSTDFDDGSTGNNTIPSGSPVPLTNEATTAGGDSGGPLVVNFGGENLIAGVLSGGTTGTSVYGDISWWTGTSNFRAAIEAKGGQFSDGSNPPTNDDFDSRINIPDPDFNVTGTNVDATIQTGEQQLENTGSTVWWFFDADEDGTITIDTFGSNFDTQLHIFTDSENGFPNLTPVVNNDNAGGTLQSRVTFDVLAGKCYEIRVGGFLITGETDSGAEGDILLNGLFTPVPPQNDDFDSRINIADPDFTVTGTNVNATTETEEQQLENTGATVWWSFDADEDGTITIDTFGSNFDTQLHIYTNFENGFPNLVPVVNNDDAAGTLQSQVTFNVLAGKCYEIRVGGFFSGGQTGPDAEGNIVINGSSGIADPPANDNFINTISVGTLPFTTTGTNINATTEPDEQELDITGATVWWYFTAPEDGMAVIDTFGSDFDTVLHIYDGWFAGAGPGDINPVVNNDQAGGTNQSAVTFPVIGGQFYEIRVGGLFSATGEITLNGSLKNDVLLGDVNCDGVVNLLDVTPFVELISSGGFSPKADINGDGTVNLLDVGPFVELLSG